MIHIDEGILCIDTHNGAIQKDIARGKEGVNEVMEHRDGAMKLLAIVKQTTVRRKGPVIRTYLITEGTFLPIFSSKKVVEGFDAGLPIARIIVRGDNVLDIFWREAFWIGLIELPGHSLAHMD
jgi:hypothetical protein